MVIKTMILNTERGAQGGFYLKKINKIKLICLMIFLAPGVFFVSSRRPRSISRNFQTWLINGTRPGDRVMVILLKVETIQI